MLKFIFPLFYVYFFILSVHLCRAGARQLVAVQVERLQVHQVADLCWDGPCRGDSRFLFGDFLFS